MVLGLFLLVLGVYSFVSFAPAGVHDLSSSLLRRYTKIGLCRELLGDVLTASVAMEDESFEVKAMALVEVNGLS